MNEAETSTLAESDLAHVQGGYPAVPGAAWPEDGRGKPLFPDYRIPEENLPKPFVKPVAGEQTPPTVVPTFA